MNTVCHNQRTFESLFSKEIIADFEGGRITSEAGGQDRLGSSQGTVLCALGQELIRNGRRVYFLQPDNPGTPAGQAGAEINRVPEEVVQI